MMKFLRSGRSIKRLIFGAILVVAVSATSIQAIKKVNYAPSQTIADVPEPALLSLLGLGFVTMASVGRRTVKAMKKS